MKEDDKKMKKVHDLQVNALNVTHSKILIYIPTYYFFSINNQHKILFIYCYLFVQYRIVILTGQN